MTTGVGGDGRSGWVSAVWILGIEFTSRDVVCSIVDVGGTVIIVNAVVCIVCC